MNPVRLVLLAGALAVISGCASNKEEPKPAPAPAQTQPAAQPKATPKPAPAPASKTPPADEDNRPTREALKVRFGIMPASYEEGNDGVQVGEVFPKTSAADGGIKPGDRMVTWNGKKIADVRQWMEYMMPAKPGDVVDVGVVRDGKTINLKVTLKAAE